MELLHAGVNSSVGGICPTTALTVVVPISKPNSFIDDCSSWLISRKKALKIRAFRVSYYSHSMVPMGLGVRSRQTRLMPSTS